MHFAKWSLLSCLVMAGLTACDEDDDDYAPASEMEEKLQQDSWRITEFVDDGQDETNDYNSVVLTFADNGNLSATASGSMSTQGSWLTRVDDGQRELWIQLQGSEFWLELNEDWYLLRETTDQMEFYDDDSSLDRLTLTREP
jgi:hypothetical protein